MPSREPMTEWDASTLKSVTLGEDGLTLTNDTTGKGHAVGLPLMRDGEHSFAVEIVKSDGYRTSAGAHLYVGVVEADPSSGAVAGRCRTWQYYPYCHVVHESVLGGCHSGADEYPGNLQGHANGSIVEVRVDMTKRKLSFCINDSAVLHMDGELPAAVRPAVSLYYRGDMLRLLPVLTVITVEAERATHGHFGICCTTLGGVTIAELQAGDGMTLGGLRDDIAQATGIPAVRCKLLSSAGEVLDPALDDRVLEDVFQEPGTE